MKFAAYHPTKLRKIPRMLEKDGLSWKYDQCSNYWVNTVACRQRAGIIRTLGRHNPTFSMRRQYERYMAYWSSHPADTAKVIFTGLAT